MHLVVDDIELHQWRRAGAVDHHGDLAAAVVEVRKDLVEQHRDDLIRRAQLLAMGPRFAVDADADLHLVVRQHEPRFACGRDRAGGDRRTHGAHVVDHPLSCGLDLLQRGALFRLGPGDLMDKKGSGDAAPSRGVQAVLDGDVVVRDDVIHQDPLVARQVRRHLEIHDVARVVLHDHQDALLVRDGLDALQDLIRGRGCEDGPGHGAIQHPLAHKPDVGGLVPAAAAADQRDLIPARPCAHKHAAALQPAQIRRVGLGHPLEHLLFNKPRIVDKLFHGPFLPCKEYAS